MVELIALRSPADLYAKSPEMFFAELITYVTFALGLWHARRNGPAHVLFFLIALCAASFVDPFCLISPQIRNYFHSHASVLMWDRHVAPWQFPFFADLAYVGGAVVWALGLDLVSETLLVGFVSSYTFYVFDVYACRWLLYQWHNQDPLYQARTLCVPLASSMWVMTYSMTASLLGRLGARFVERHGLTWDAYTMAFALPAGVLVFLPLHIVPISLVYFPTYVAGQGSYAAVLGFGLACLAVAAVRTKAFAQRRPSDAALWIAVAQSAVWFGGCFSVLVLLDPGNVVSKCVHEPFGGASAATSALCTETETYLFGLGVRKRYVCADELAWWRIAPDTDTGALPLPGDERYTIRGLPMDDETFWHQARSIALGVAVHAACFALAATATKRKKSKQL